MQKELNIETIKKYRLRCGYNQKEVSYATGIDIGMLESGFTKGIKLSSLYKLANLYKCSFNNLYEEELVPEIKTHILYKK